MMNRAEYRNGILGRLGCYRVAAFRAFGAWELAESGQEVCNGVSGMGAKWNPYNTTLGWPKATNYNSAGVKNYQSFTDGADATVATINESQFKPIRDALADQSASASDILEAIAGTPWGTSLSGLMSALDEYQNDRGYFNALNIGT